MSFLDVRLACQQSCIKIATDQTEPGLTVTPSQIVYLPAAPTPQLQSFTAPILNLHDTHVTAPFFGPNVWIALVQPVQGGGIPPQHAAIELKMTFKDGGAFDFHSRFERVKERLQQAVEVARESGQVAGDGSEQGRGRGAGALGGVNMDSVHLDQLPAYEEPGMPLSQALGAAAATTVPQVSSSTPPSQRDRDTAATNPIVSPQPSRRRASLQELFSPPAEPPPGYEEVQRETVVDELERRLSG
ncbi:hypothetical protein B0A49_13949 [Cryomyces minteri]|uniref:Uncharacterized protein n=1 Tax=Cryomyces minteri TaxID=331657 RepID=A0A4U0V049_9PEZI|nr:hypothetical protein B0A49_13949 [Cryomyces minteri]